MKKAFFLMSLSFGVMAFTASTASAQGDFGPGGPPTFLGGGQVTLVADLPFTCSSITITSVNGAVVTAQDACGNTLNIVAAGNTGFLTTGMIISINNTNGNGGNIITIQAN